MRYDELNARMVPESVEEFAETLVNAFANGSCSDDTCPFFQDACDEIWPGEEDD